MTGTTKAVSLAIATTFLLTACEEGAVLSPATQGATSSDSAAIIAPPAQSVTRDVERPDIFSASETALWDGRPSLGGVWVAHPDVGDPERVMITNPSNGRSISGALFRRERNNPGPRIQVSSDAAEALGLLAGQPTELSLVVVRSEEVEVAPPPVTDIEDATTPAEDGGVDDAAAASVSVVTAAAAAIAEAEGESPAPDLAIESDVIAADATVAAVAPAPIDRDAVAAAAAMIIAGDMADETAAAAAAAAAEAEAMQMEAAASVDTASDASVPNVETGALAPVGAIAAAAIDEAEAAPAPARAETSDLKNPYVQVGLFKLEDNANDAAKSLRQAGIVPQVKRGNNDSGAYWRVIVGPMTTAEDQSALLSQVKGLGYRDAFLTTN